MLRAALLIALVLSAQIPSKRDEWQRADDITAKLNLRPGSCVADIGAGSGYFTERLARAVGASGRVLAAEISEKSVEHLRKAFKDSPQVEIVHGGHDNPKLPQNGLDAVLIVDAYHEFQQPATMLKEIRAAMKPGAALVIADYTNDRFHDQSREQQAKQHVLAPLIVVEELRAARFAVSELLDPFIPRNPKVSSMRIGRHDMFLIVAKRTP